MAVYRSTYEFAKNHPSAMEELCAHANKEAGQQRVYRWLMDTGLVAKCSVQVIAMWNDGDTSRLIAHAMVYIKGGKYFEHEETYIQFPSEHFKTKVLLTTGGV